MKNLKVVFFLPNFHGGGAERVAINYIRRLDPERYDIALAALSTEGDLKCLVPRSVRVIDLNCSRTLLSFFKMLNFLQEEQPDVVYTTHSRITCLLSMCSYFCKNFKHVARAPNSPVLERRYKNFSFISRILFLFGYKRASIVVAQTSEMKKELVEFYYLNSDNVVVLNNPIDTVSIRESLLEPSVNPFAEGSISAVAAGRINEQKGFDVLIRALPSVLQHFPYFHLYVLGQDRGDLPDVERLIKELDLDDVVHILGFKKNPYVYYNNCSLFVLSSRWEGFPNAMLENYYLNTPIVATRCVPIVEDLIEDGVNGTLCEVEDVDSLANAIIRCLSISRTSILNKPYKGSSLEVVLE